MKCEPTYRNSQTPTGPNLSNMHHFDQLIADNEAKLLRAIMLTALFFAGAIVSAVILAKRKGKL
jgi:hypothetical protein